MEVQSALQIRPKPSVRRLLAAISPTVLMQFHLPVSAFQHPLASLILHTFQPLLIGIHPVGMTLAHQLLMTYYPHHLPFAAPTARQTVHLTHAAVEHHAGLPPLVGHLLSSFKQPLPVMLRRWQTEPLVQSHIVQHHTIPFSLGYPQPTANHLQILCERKGRTGQLHKLHIRAVKTLAEQIHTHQHPYLLTLPEAVYQFPSHIIRRIAADSHRLYPVLTVVVRYMFRMLNADGIHHPLLLRHILPHRLVQPFDARAHIQPLAQLRQHIIPISPSPLQRVDGQLVGTVRSDGVIVIHAQPPFGDKPLHAPRREQHVKQVSESFPVQSARSSRQSQFLRLWESIHHLGIRLSQSMMRFIYHYHPRLLLHLLVVSREPLHRHHPYSVLLQTIRHSIPIPENPSQCPLYLLHQLPSVRHYPHNPPRQPLQEPLHHRSQQHRLPRSRRHLCHHRLMHQERPLNTPPHLPLIVKQLHHHNNNYKFN